MDRAEFQRAAISACDQYLSFLEMHKTAGKSFVSVSGKTEHAQPPRSRIFDLQIEKALKYPDSVGFEIQGKPIDERDIEIIKYDKKKAPFRLTVRVAPSFYSTFCNLDIQQLQLVSDFSFLIRRLKQFYANIKVPLSAPDPIVPSSVEWGEGLSFPQSAAVDCALHNPVSYIWGPPGTGKTSYVLSSCILSYALYNQRVLLLAPTNNAIEQVLYGLMPVLEKAGISRKTVCRIGIASDRFAATYPELLEDTEQAHLQDEARRQYLALQEELRNRQDFEQKVEQSAQQLQQLRQECDMAIEFLRSFEPLYLASMERKETRAALQREETDHASSLVTLDRTVQDLRSKLNSTEHQASELTQKLRRYRFLPFSGTKKHLISAQLKILNETKRTVSEELTTATNALQSENSELQETRKQLNSIEKELADLEQHKKDSLSRFKSRCTNEEVWNIVYKLSYQDDCALSHSFAIRERKASPSQYTLHKPELECRIEDLYMQEQANHEVLLTSCELRPLQTIQAELAEQGAVIDSLATSEEAQRRENALIIASTIDSALSFLMSPEHRKFQHVFLDEAGYTSILRGMVPFCCGCPVTFLGDHFQIPPICEKNTIETDEQELCLWALPICYYTDLITGSLPDLYRIYKSLQNNHTESLMPTCDKEDIMAYAPLNETYRFPAPLAEVLQKYIYRTDFRGVAPHPFELLVYHAADTSPNDRISKEEAKVIAWFLSTQPDMEDFAIFAPYNKQVNEIQSRVGKDRAEVLTVHRSQGQEYDTVILSVTDTSRKFLVDTNCHQGRSVLNTAISRTKKRLVLVCDVNYWLRQEKQLITELIHLAEQP